MTVTVELMDDNAIFALLAGVIDRAKRDAGKGNDEAMGFCAEWQPFGADADAERAKWKRLGKRAKWR